MSVELERNGDLYAALKEAQAAQALDPTCPEVQRQLGHLYGRAGEREQCIEAWKKVVELTGGEECEAIRALGIALSNHQQHEEAIEVLERAVTLEPRDPSAHADLGMARLAAHRLVDAEISFRQAANLDPASGQAHLGLGLMYARKKDWVEASREFRTTVRLVPSSVIAHFNLGLALEVSGEMDEARIALLRAAALAPDDVEIAASLNRVLGTKTSEDEKTDPSNSINGDLTPFPLTDLLEFLRIQGKSGTLTVTSRHGAGVLRLREGRLISASSPRAPRLKDVPVDRALMFEQILTSIAEILSWKAGTFSFQKQEDRGDQQEPAFDLQLTILELYRRSDEQKSASN